MILCPAPLSRERESKIETRAALVLKFRLVALILLCLTLRITMVFFAILTAGPYSRHNLPQVFERALQVFCLQPISFIGLGLALVVPLLVIKLCVEVQMFDFFLEAVDGFIPTDGGYENNSNDPNDIGDRVDSLEEHEKTLLNELSATLLLTGLLAAVVKAATVHATIQVYLRFGNSDAAGHPHQALDHYLRDSIKTIFYSLCYGVKKLPTMICWLGLFLLCLLTYFVASLFIVNKVTVLVFQIGGVKFSFWVGFLLTIATTCLGISLALFFIFCFPVIVVERANAGRSIARAWTIARGHRSMVFFTLVAGSAFALLVKQTGNLVLVIFGADLYVYEAVHLASSLFLVPFGGIVVTVVYLNVRIDNEGLNRDVLLKEVKDLMCNSQPVSVADTETARFLENASAEDQQVV